MNRFLKWLGHRLFGKKPKKPVDLRRAGSRVSPGRPKIHSVPTKKPGSPVPPPRGRNDDQAAGAGLAIEDGGPGKNVLVRNRFIREDTGTHETLKIFDDSVLESEEVKGFDPYNTGRFDRSKHWDKRTRE